MRRLLLAFGLLLVWAPQMALARVFYVGPLHEFKQPSAVARLVAAGDEVQIEPGEYYDCALWPVDRLTIVGRGSGAVMTDRQCNGKASFIINGDDVVLRNLTFTRIRVPDRNGAGIRHQGGDLTVENCRFINNEAGIISSGVPDARIVIRDSMFEQNGACVDGRCTASLIVPDVTVLRLERTRFVAPRGGSLLRSNARRSVLIDNYFDDGPDGAALPMVIVTGDLQADGNRFVRRQAGAGMPAILEHSLWRTPMVALERNSLVADAPTLLLLNMSSADPVMADNAVPAGGLAVSNEGLLVARARDAARRGVRLGAHLVGPLARGVQRLEGRMLPP